ncbi:hypothetical protein TYRP_020754 [Tyrophagus putrescentiae]|nr:hypothetical protein TYRP_020754 [Tyrophagus putrescentiae]
MKMKLSLLLTLIVFGAIVANKECSSSPSPLSPLNRSKRGITDFIRRLVGGRRKNPAYPHQHQSGSSSSSPFGQSVGSSSLYGGGNTAAGGGQDFLYGQASNQYPMYQSGNGGLQQQQASEYVFPGISASQSGGFAFGNYGSPNGNNAQQQPQFYYNQAGQDNSAYANQGEQQQYQQQGGEQHQPHHHLHHHPQQYHMQQQQPNSFHHPGGYHHQQQQHFQQTGQQQQYQHGPGALFLLSSSMVGQHSAVTADQDGIASNSNSNNNGPSSSALSFSQQTPLMTAAQSQAVAAYLNANSNAAVQQQFPGFAASYNRPQYAPYPEGQKAYGGGGGGSNPGTLDVHQVLDQFIRSAGLSPQGDHEAVKGDQHYADGADLKPALSVKKLISYPFYFSSSGDKPTSYGQSIRRHSQDETIFKSALNQNLLASQKMEQPANSESKMEPSSSSSSSSSSSASSPSSYSQAAVSSSDEESQFIAKHAQALQEFLSKPPNTQSSSAAHYYSPLSESSSAKDNKVTSSSSSSSSSLSSSSVHGQTKV